MQSTIYVKPAFWGLPAFWGPFTLVYRRAFGEILKFFFAQIVSSNVMKQTRKSPMLNLKAYLNLGSPFLSVTYGEGTFSL